MALNPADNKIPYADMKGRLRPELMKAIEGMGYTHMSPVQHKVLSELPSFSDDCLVQAKTGTISNVRALSGYLTTKSGEKLAFSMIANNFIAPSARIDAIMEAALARLLEH